MRSYGNTLFAENGFSLVEVVEMDVAGSQVVVGYAILDPDGDEISFLKSYDDAVAEIRRILEDNDSTPSLSM